MTPLLSPPKISNNNSKEFKTKHMKSLVQFNSTNNRLLNDNCLNWTPTDFFFNIR